MTLADTHVHLNFPEFREDMETVIARAFAGGVATMINVGTDAQTSQESVNLAERYATIYATVGIHPHFADAFESQLDQIRSLARHSKVVAIGEVGLDYFRNLSAHSRQIAAFKSQLDLAIAVGKPVVLHCRDAYTEALSILEEDYLPRLNGRVPGVIHPFAAGLPYLQQFLKLGFYIGINNLVTYPKSVALRDAIIALPLERLVIETDCPYLPPQSLRGGRCEPAHVIAVARELAQLKGVPVEQIEEISTQNARTVFNLN
ncbi:MAG: TatD family hydrolase [bacterium]